jgi:iron complex transport system ATP-binding protein
MRPPDLAAIDLALAYNSEHPVVEGLNLAIQPGTITALTGPNGCGKSTLLRGFARILKPQSGSVELFGEPLERMDTLAVARKLGILPQRPIAPEAITVRQLVLLGRHPHRKWWQTSGPEDVHIADAAMRNAEVLEFADRLVVSLSGGQQQRAWIAMMLAQQSSILLLDEPTTFLDMAHQLEVLDLLSKLNAEAGATIVLVLHDLNLAARYADKIIMMKDGRIAAAGNPEEVITKEWLVRVFSVHCNILQDPVTNRPFCIPIDIALPD